MAPRYPGVPVGNPELQQALLGTGAGIAFFMLTAHRTIDAVTIAAVARIVVLADFIFTATVVVLQPITGIALGALHPGSGCAAQGYQRTAAMGWEGLPSECKQDYTEIWGRLIKSRPPLRQ